MSGSSALDTIHALRAVRRYQDRPIPVPELRVILEAATMAGSSGNTQPWEFLIVTDREIKHQFKRLALQFMAEVEGERAQSPEQLIDGAGRPVTGDAAYESLEQVPVIVLVFWNPDRGIRMRDEYIVTGDGTLRPGPGAEGRDRGASIYMACQNMMLAAHTLGVGSLFTTGLTHRANEIKQIVGAPPRMFLEAVILLGYSAEKLGRPRRTSIDQIAHTNRWGNHLIGE